MNRITEYYDSLSLKKKIIILSVILLILIIITNQYNYHRKNARIQYCANLNYKTLTSESLLENYKESYANRDDYLIIKNIIEGMYKKYDENKNIYTQYKDALDYDFKKSEVDSKIIKRLNSLMGKIHENGQYNIKLYSANYIEGIYVAELCDENESTYGYIGFVLNKNKFVYDIFYIDEK